MTDNHSSKTAYDFDCVDLHGKPLSLNQFKGQPLVIVNTASLCGSSFQYKGLENLWKKHKHEGLVVIGVPTNDFGRQEPGNSAAIASLCSLKFGVTFPLIEKTPITGPEAHPLFKWIAEEGGFFAKPRWNFYKYIIGRNGRLVDWYSTLTTSTSSRFENAVVSAVKNS
jgi:glutathione peroxidase